MSEFCKYCGKELEIPQQEHNNGCETRAQHIDDEKARFDNAQMKFNEVLRDILDDPAPELREYIVECMAFWKK